MTARPDPALRPVVKLTSQLTRGDHIHIDGLGGFAVTHAQPFGTQALIRLAWENLAVITARDTRWQAITPTERIYLHGSSPAANATAKASSSPPATRPNRSGTAAHNAGSPPDPHPSTGRAPAHPRCPAPTHPEGRHPLMTIYPGAFPFSMFDPVHLGIDENGEHVYVDLAERNMLLGGEPGGGKSSGLNLITAHGALSYDCKLILVDGKQVELGPWRHCADMFIGPSIKDAIEAFESFQATMDNRYKTLLATGRRKIVRDRGDHVYLIVIDEYAYFSATVGSKQDREKFAALTRDLVARGRAAGVIIILATQRPSHQVIDPSMRDLFGYRWAFRCTTDSSSDVVLGQGWANEGYTAADIDPLARGVGYLLSETGVPRRIKAAYLDDGDIKYLAAYAAKLRHGAVAA